ncbi:MAG: hypothetical protein ACXWTP_00125 [Methylosarcina sp.]
MDKYLDWVKNHKWLGIVVALGMVVIAVGNFTDSIGKITQFINSLSDTSPQKETISLLIKVKNERDVKIEISPFVRYYLTEDKGAMIQEYDGGRLLLKPIEVEDKNNPNIISPHNKREYLVILPDSLVNSRLLERGSGNMHVNLTVIGENKIYLESFPLLKEAFTKFDIEYTISPNE